MATSMGYGADEKRAKEQELGYKNGSTAEVYTQGQSSLAFILSYRWSVSADVNVYGKNRHRNNGRSFAEGNRQILLRNHGLQEMVSPFAEKQPRWLISLQVSTLSPSKKHPASPVTILVKV